MRWSSRVLSLLAFVFLLSGLARADSTTPTDPRIGIAGSGNSTDVGLTFSFTSNATGGGIFDFINNSGQDWFNLSITTKFPGGDLNKDYQCAAPGIFMNCQFSLSSDGSMINVLFFGVGSGTGSAGTLAAASRDDTFTGIRNGQEFIISLNNPGSSTVGGWVPNTRFDAIANIPEPASMTLFLVGLGAIAIGRKLRRWKTPGD